MKKIFFLLISSLVITNMVSCNSKSYDFSQNVDEFLSHLDTYDNDKAEEFARNAITKEDYEAAHKCINFIKTHGGYAGDLQLDVCSEETKYLLSNDPSNALPRIKFFLADMTPDVAKPAIGIEGYDAFQESENYKDKAEAYNTLLNRIVDYLLAIDMKDEAAQFASKGLDIPVWKGGKFDGELIEYSNDDAKAIAEKIK